MRQLDLLPSLGSGDLERLLGERDPDARVAVARQVGRLLADSPLSDAERALACDIVERLSRDLEETVRRAVARSLKDCPLLPHRVALRLAEDIDSVALPLLQATSVLSEAELIELVRGGNLAKQVAIARRRVVPEPLSDALIETRRPPVLTTLLENPGAEIGEAGLHRIIDLGQQDPATQRAIVCRLHLPLTVQQRLVGVLSQELCDLLVERHALPQGLIERFVRQGGEGALARLARRERRVEEVEALTWRLQAEGRLTTTLVLRALLEGDLHLFEAALARLAGVPTPNARTIVYHGGSEGLHRLYDRTGLPPDLFRAVELGVEVACELGAEAAPRVRGAADPALAARIIERIVADYRDVCPAALETVLSQLALHAGEAPAAARG